MTYKIYSNEFWNNLRHLYPVEKQWHLKDSKIQKISKSILGLQFVETRYDEDEFGNPHSAIFLFKIINRHTFTWAKMKYGI